MRLRFPSEDLSRVTETTALDHLWSYGTDENFLQNCEDTYGFFRHRATFPRKKNCLVKGYPFTFMFSPWKKRFASLKLFLALRDFWKKFKKKSYDV